MMSNFSYHMYKNKEKIIIVAVLIIIVSAFIGYKIASSEKDKPDSEDVIVNNEGVDTEDGSTAIITAPPNIDDGIREVTEKQVVARVTDAGTVYEVTLDKITNITYLFKDGEQTNVICKVDKAELDEPLITINKDIDDIPLSSLGVPKIAGAYDINTNTASGVVNHFKTLGAQELRLVETQEYFEVYLKEKDGTIKRIIATEGLMLIADYIKEELPAVNSYWREY